MQNIGYMTVRVFTGESKSHNRSMNWVRAVILEEDISDGLIVSIHNKELSMPLRIMSHLILDTTVAYRW